MVWKSYFDGGNESDNPEFSHACLATVCGSDRQWRMFNSDWQKVLYRHKANFLHTTDAVSLKNEFSTENGWTDRRVNAFIGDCVRTIGKHIEIPEGAPGRGARGGLYPVTFMIPLTDWLRARAENPSLPNTVAEVCTTESLGFCFKRGTQLGAKRFELYFDRGEPFYGHVSDRWRSSKARSEMPLLTSVARLGEADMRAVSALQMADLFAWCINHNHVVVRDWHKALHSLPWSALFLDYPKLIRPRPRAIELTRSLKLPQRQTTESRIEKMGMTGKVPDIPKNLLGRK